MSCVARSGLLHEKAHMDGDRHESESKSVVQVSHSIKVQQVAVKPEQESEPNTHGRQDTGV